MFNLQQYHDKVIREIQHRQGGEQIIIHFTDESFLIVSADISGSGLYSGGFGSKPFLSFSGRSIDK